MRLVPFALLGLALLVGCASPATMAVTHSTAVAQAPLESEMALVVPAEKNDILGLIYDDPALMEGHSLRALGDQLRDNPCAEFLTRADEKQQVHVADVWPVTDPLVPQLGFEMYLGVSTHLFVLLESSQSSFAAAGEDYPACCEKEDCGAGFVSAVYEGELNVNTALHSPSPSPPIVLIDRAGGALGLSLHEGKAFRGVVAVELAER